MEQNKKTTEEKNVTYIYFYKINGTKDWYVGQHRDCVQGDPLKGTYKGGGSGWKKHLKELGLYETDAFRNGVEKTILEEWHGKVSSDIVNEAEKFWIKNKIEEFGKEHCFNEESGGGQTYKYDDVDAATEAVLESKRKWFSGFWTSERGKKANQLNYERNGENIKRHQKVVGWAKRHNYPKLDESVFPPKWSEDDINEYVRIYNNKSLK